jgi:uncharacterized protein (TIGR02246 family)
MRASFLASLMTTAYVCFATVAVAADQKTDEAAIRENARKYVETFNARDAKKLAAFWSPEAVYMNPLSGEEVTGRAEIEKQFAGIFAESKDAKLEVTVDSVEFVSPNVAIERGTARVIRPKEEPEVSNYSAVDVKREGQWLLDRVTEADKPAAAPSNYDHLKELEWMIGSWIDQDENATIQTDCEWTKNRNFMTRAFAVVIGDEVNSSGMQIIGWDPATKQIRSWVFDSDGGFSEGKWSRKGDRWYIRQAGTLPDGGKSSALNIMTRVDDNSFTWQSINREVDGDVLPNVAEVRVVRKPTE